jgi:hypothetical protein
VPLVVGVAHMNIIQISTTFVHQDQRDNIYLYNV